MALAVGSIGVASAAAATETGNGCEFNEIKAGVTLMALANAGGSPQTTIPVSGVITSWKVRTPAIPANTETDTLKVFRPTGTSTQVEVVGESETRILSGGVNTFAARIPVQAGDRLGSTGVPESLLCMTGNNADKVATIAGNPVTGATVALGTEIFQAALPAVAVIEPDADGDGFGDETQDKCPQNAAFQTACPTASIPTGSTPSAVAPTAVTPASGLDAVSVVGKRSLVVFVSSGSAAPVSLTATASLGRGKRVALRAPGQTVAAGKIARFKLKFPAKLITRLKQLPPSRSLALKVTAGGVNAAGVASSRVIVAKLKGQG